MFGDGINQAIKEFGDFGKSPIANAEYKKRMKQYIVRRRKSIADLTRAIEVLKAVKK